MIDLIRNRYLSNHKENTLRHVEEVADTAVWLAEVYNLDSIKVKLAALLHDISAIMYPQDMYELAKVRGLEIDAAEEKYHFLLHQRISRIIAQEDYGINDSDILDAIECHTTLKKNASVYDKVIFIADKISWDQKGVPPYYDILKSKVVESLDEACYFYINYQFENNLLLMPHQWIRDAYEELRNAFD
ncbi:MAG: bis(5'-nucleosyl)-tetraphosphatase (symmetrical) YqeK [Lachnospiraceae bacterium]|nr:bis(5'-nucleosyl)-tetraphosphatase (symmetrical) YqeK [Lachnospiraceae bacterium]